MTCTKSEELYVTKTFQLWKNVRFLIAVLFTWGQIKIKQNDENNCWIYKCK